MGDWLGTGWKPLTGWGLATNTENTAYFKEAREFVHTLKLKSATEWRQVLQGRAGGRKPKPEDIPATPDRTYKDRGWQGMGDWLGTGTIASYNKKYRPFEEAQEFVHTLKLKSETEWRKYCKGELEGVKPKPEDIPASPNNTYKDQGWQGMGDWLGTGTIASYNKEYRPFEEARKFVHALKLKSGTEWRKYCKGELEGRIPKPEDIPAKPYRTYKIIMGLAKYGRLELEGVGDGQPLHLQQRIQRILSLKSETEWRKYFETQTRRYSRFS